MIADYDDGRSTIPGGISGPVERVIVIGAGIAGLTVANALTHAGVDCVVLEARDRIGGRLHTVDLGGWPADLGGSWIHHPDGNPLRQFARQAGISCAAANPLAELGGFDCAEEHRLTKSEVGADIELLYETFPDAVERLRDELGPEASVAEAIEVFVPRCGLTPVAARRARQGLRAVIEAESADMSERQSLRWMWNEIDYGGDYFGDLPAGGYASLVTAMAAGLDVRLGVDVDAVAYSASGVVVRSVSGVTHEGSHVVVTVPLGVLKGGTPQFFPALPPDRVAATERLGFGRFEKVILQFEQPFWRAAGLPHMMLLPHDRDEATVWVIGQDAFDAGPVLDCFIFHSASSRVLGSAQAGAAWVLGMLGEAIGGPCPAPSNVAVTSWGNDPRTRGAYTHIPPGAQPDDADLLGEPIDGRLLFAGEHTQSARLAYADGAMTSGIREAKRLLQQPSAGLGRLTE